VRQTHRCLKGLALDQRPLNATRYHYLIGGSHSWPTAFVRSLDGARAVAGPAAPVVDPYGSSLHDALAAPAVPHLPDATSQDPKRTTSPPDWQLSATASQVARVRLLSLAIQATMGSAAIGYSGSE
jgi:hypothetical protein